MKENILIKILKKNVLENQYQYMPKYKNGKNI